MQQHANIKRITFKTNLLVNQVLGDVYLSQSQLIMVFVVQHVHQVGVERMDVLKEKMANDHISQTTFHTCPDK